MPRFSLRFSGRHGEQGSPLSFDAVDASGALAIAQRHGEGRDAELWAEDKLVCRISVDSEAGFWRIG